MRVKTGTRAGFVLLVLSGAVIFGTVPACTDALVEGLTDRSVTELVDAIDAFWDQQCACDDTMNVCNESLRSAEKLVLARCLQRILDEDPEAEATYECATQVFGARAVCYGTTCSAMVHEDCDRDFVGDAALCPPLPEYENCLL